MANRAQSTPEEIANTVVHAAALVTLMAAIPLLFRSTELPSTSAVSVAGSAVFAVTLVFLYLCSTLYHALRDGRTRRVLLRLDHGAIFLFIAGSFTPFGLASADGAIEWTQLCTVWLFALAGFILKACGRLSHPLLSNGLYLLMGWVVLTLAAPLMQRLPPLGLCWLIASGVAYTVGVVFFVLDSRMRFAHAVWHGFVVAGTTCHFMAIWVLNHQHLT